MRSSQLAAVSIGLNGGWGRPAAGLDALTAFSLGHWLTRHAGQ